MIDYIIFGMIICGIIAAGIYVFRRIRKGIDKDDPGITDSSP
ncbi:MAG: hypothetical protein ABI581_07785 [Sediminibacterium sp.]